MKTEQELKDELEDIFFDALTDKSNPPYYTDKVDPENDSRWQWKVYELCSDELIKRGYGDVSEYKAEIERLKAENCELTKKLEARLTCDFVKTAQKQAKIDILNKAKERIKTAIDTYFNLDGGGYYLAEGAIDDIDELIEEVEK